MPCTEASAKCLDTQVIAVSACGPDAFLLDLELSEDLGPLTPGVFAMLSRTDGQGPELARPFSLYDQLGPRHLRFLIQVLGQGTRLLSQLQLGEAVWMTFPLGNGFSVAPSERPVVLVAGGIGSAPFLLYARERMAAGAGAATQFLFGARSADRLYDRQAFEQTEVPILYATDDGSLGFSGNVVQCLEAELQAGRMQADALYCACGPEGLLHGFAEFARRNKLEAQLSLETYMGCGFGVCNACPVPTHPDGKLSQWPWARTCVQGPVFDLADIQF
jgi:dihydroorotate dehydrogenase electron transfer subunit